MNGRRPRGRLLVVHHGFISMCRFRRLLDVVHRAHGHGGDVLPPGSSCGTRLLPPAYINDTKDDKCQENEGIEPHYAEHDRDEGIESVQGSLRCSDATRRGTDGLYRSNIVGDVGSGLGASGHRKIPRSFVWINQRKEFDERVAHLALVVEIPEIVDRVDTAKDIVTDQPIARLVVRM